MKTLLEWLRWLSGSQSVEKSSARVDKMGPRDRWMHQEEVRQMREMQERLERVGEQLSYIERRRDKGVKG